MRFHVVSLPHTQTTHEYLTCAYTQKVVKWCGMMYARGHEVYLYAGDENDANCTELITCVTREEQESWFGPFDLNDPWTKITWDPVDNHWVVMNRRVVKAVRERMEPGDFLLLITGTQRPIAEGIPELPVVTEFGVGYCGVRLEHHLCFESDAWRHYVYGWNRLQQGRWYDTVIPNYFDIKDFIANTGKPDDFLLFLGRIISLKGVHVAADIADEMNMKLIVAGPGGLPVKGGGVTSPEVTIKSSNVEYVGPVGLEDRKQLLASAKALLAPTMYLEPFGGVAVEAMMSGTPAVTTNFGAFTETVQEGLSGHHFHTLMGGVEAVETAMKLDRKKVVKYARGKYSLEAVAPMYESWFERLGGLYGEGWYAGRKEKV